MSKAEAPYILRKYSAKPFGQLQGLELELMVSKMLAVICASTGWKIPEDDTTLSIIENQFKTYLTVVCPTINEVEMEHAFVANTANVKDWGKAVNLILISEVLQPYMEERRRASEIENQVLGKLSGPKPEEMPKVPPEEMLQVCFDVWRKSKQKGRRWQFISVTVYEYLVSIGKISLTDEQKRNYLKAANSITAMDLDNDPHAFLGSDMYQIRVGYAKRMAVNDYFLKITTEENEKEPI